MELKQLQYFTSVVEEGSISAAAKKLYISQPPLTTMMQALERECGGQLFVRGARQIRLTDAGKLLYDRAITILRLSGAARDEVQALLEGVGGTLKIGSISSASTLLADWCADFSKLYPEVKFSLSEGNTYETLEALRTGSVDIAVVRTPFAEDGFDCRRLNSEPMLAAGAAEFFSGADVSKALPLSFFSGKPLIVYRRWEDILRRAFASEGAELSVICQNDDARTTAVFAERGIGMVILPLSGTSLLRGCGLELHEIDSENLHTTVTLVTRSAAYLPAVVQAFIDNIQNLQ